MSKHVSIIAISLILAASAFGDEVKTQGSKTAYQLDMGGARFVPQVISFQGYLTDSLGTAITDTQSMMFEIYSGYYILWSETQDVPVENGVFNAFLGSVNPIPGDVFTGGTDREFEVTVEGEALSPRTQISATGYAYEAAHADTADYAHAGPGVSDDDWIRSDSVLYTGDYWGIARGSAGNALFGDSAHTMVNFGISCTTGTSGQTMYYSTIGGGHGNAATWAYATVGGGIDNLAGYPGATVAGGDGNTASGQRTTVAGGQDNTASGDYATVAGGNTGSASGNNSFVGGGTHNSAIASEATVCGGGYNSASSGYSVVAGGYYNAASGVATTIAGGYFNSANVEYGTIGGGCFNAVNADYATVGGGRQDTAKACYGGVLSGWENLAGNSSSDTAAVVAGGRENRSEGRYTTIGGGYQNYVSSYCGTIGGGDQNQATSLGAFVGGGQGNVADGNCSVISGGRYNISSGLLSTVGGGFQNQSTGLYSTIGGGGDNLVSGLYGVVSGGRNHMIEADYAAIPGGREDTLTADAECSMAFGREVYLDQPYHISFFHGGEYSGRVGINRDDRDTVFYPLHIGTNGANGNGAYLTGGGIWTDASSRTKKEDFQRLDGPEVLRKVEDLEVTRWKFKGTEERHIGPVAEDFHAEFECGPESSRDASTSIAAMDLAGVSLVAIQELSRLVRDLQVENQELRERIEVLEK
jgi:hypothetical protein